MGTYNSSPKTLADGEQRDSLLDSSGRLITTSVGSDGASGSPLPAGADRSGSITTGGTAQNVAAANTARRGFDFQNTSDTEMRVTENGASATATTGFQVLAGGTFRTRTNRAISVFCATTGKTFAATEW